MSVEYGDEALSGLMSSQRQIPQYTRPVVSWGEIAQPEVDRECLWYRRLEHAPCDVRVPPEWGLDALYLS